MLYLYTGTPGSGKSYHLACRIYSLLRSTKVNVLANFPVDIEQIYITRLGWIKQRLQNRFGIKFKRINSRPVTGHFLYLENSEMTVSGLHEICHRDHRYKVIRINGEEQRYYYPDQTLLIIDEAAVLFNCRAWGDSSRQAWCDFFVHHRKYGYNIILVAQHERMLDRQIRYIVEMVVYHRNMKYLSFPAKILAMLCGGSLFKALYCWQGTKEPTSVELYKFDTRIASIYNTSLVFVPRGT